MINVRDNAKFSKCIFEIIGNWKHKYYWKDFTICDGTLWVLRIKLSNGKYLKYEGHQMFPDNYPKLRGYLNRFVGKYVKQIINEYIKGKAINIKIVMLEEFAKQLDEIIKENS